MGGQPAVGAPAVGAPPSVASAATDLMADIGMKNQEIEDLTAEINKRESLVRQRGIVSPDYLSGIDGLKAKRKVLAGTVSALSHTAKIKDAEETSARSEARQLAVSEKVDKERDDRERKQKVEDARSLLKAYGATPKDYDLGPFGFPMASRDRPLSDSDTLALASKTEKDAASKRIGDRHEDDAARREEAAKRRRLESEQSWHEHESIRQSFTKEMAEGKTTDARRKEVLKGAEDTRDSLEKKFKVLQGMVRSDKNPGGMMDPDDPWLRAALDDYIEASNHYEKMKSISAGSQVEVWSEQEAIQEAMKEAAGKTPEQRAKIRADWQERVGKPKQR